MPEHSHIWTNECIASGFFATRQWTLPPTHTITCIGGLILIYRVLRIQITHSPSCANGPEVSPSALRVIKIYKMYLLLSVTVQYFIFFCICGSTLLECFNSLDSAMQIIIISINLDFVCFTERN